MTQFWALIIYLWLMLCCSTNSCTGHLWPRWHLLDLSCQLSTLFQCRGRLQWRRGVPVCWEVSAADWLVLRRSLGVWAEWICWHVQVVCVDSQCFWFCLILLLFISVSHICLFRLFVMFVYLSRYQKGKISLDLNEAGDDGVWVVASAGLYANNLHLVPDR